MKTLKFMLAAATAIGLASAYADPEAGASTTFEGLTVGTQVVSGLTDEGLTTGNSYFYFGGQADENESTIEAAGDMTGIERPKGAAQLSPNQDKILNVSTGTEPLLRKFKASANDTLPAGTTFTDPVFVDTLVQFTVTPYTDTVTPGSTDKLMVYLRETTNNVEATETTTNLVVVGGFYQGEASVTAREYVLNTGSIEVKPNEWHRLTVKAIADISGGEFPDLSGFQIWVDDELCLLNVPTYKEDEDTIAMFGEFPFADELEAGKIVLSLLAGNGQAATLQAVGFAGEGKVDDLMITMVDPFVPTVDFTLAFDTAAGVSAVQYTVGGTSYSQAQTFYNLAVNTQVQIISVTPDTDFTINPYTTEGLRDDGDGLYTITNATASLTITANGVIYPVPTVAGGVTVARNGATYTFTAPAGSVISSLVVDGTPVAAAEGQSSYEWTYNGESAVSVAAAKLPATNPWFSSPKAVVLADNLPVEKLHGVSAFHGAGAGNYLGVTFGSEPQAFRLYGVNGTNAITTITNVVKADLTTPGLRGVAISEKLGIAMTMAYYTGSGKCSMYAFPLGGGAPTEVTKPSTHSFDGGAFSPDGEYFFSNAISGESSNAYCVKWSVSRDAETDAISLTKVGSKAASGRARNATYARINGRDLVFVLAEGGKVDVIDMTDDNDTAWTSATLVSELPTISYGSLCISGVNTFEGTPHLTVATSGNDGATKGDVLNVYELNVPATGAVTASLVKSFDEDALTAAGFGDISLEESHGYGNTVYVTDDEATFYFGRPDQKLYAALYVPSYTITFISGEGSTTNEFSVFEGDAVVAPEAAEVSGKTFTGWSPALVSPAVAAATYTAQYEQQSSGWADDPATIEEGTTAAEQYSVLAGTALATADAKEFTIWAKAKNVEFSTAAAAIAAAPLVYTEAFLLNCAPTAAAVAEEKAAFVLDVEFKDGVATVKLPAGKTYNGKLQMKGSNNLSQWDDINTTAGYQFFKYVLTLQ